MVLILDGKLEIGAHVRSDFSYLICIRHFTISRAVRFFFLIQNDMFSLTRAQHVLNYHLI